MHSIVYFNSPKMVKVSKVFNEILNLLVALNMAYKKKIILVGSGGHAGHV